MASSLQMGARMFSEGLGMERFDLDYFLKSCFKRIDERSLRRTKYLPIKQSRHEISSMYA